MSTTIVGIFSDELGGNLQDYRAANGWWHSRAWHAPGNEYRSQQPAFIALRVGHAIEDTIGEVLGLCRDHAQRLWAVSVSPVDLDTSAQLFYSPEINSETDRSGTLRRDIELRGLALVSETAGIGVPAVTILAGDPRSSVDRACWPADLPQRELVTRALTGYRRNRDTTELVDWDSRRPRLETRIRDDEVNVAQTGPGRLSSRRGALEFGAWHSGSIISVR